MMVEDIVDVVDMQDAGGPTTGRLASRVSPDRHIWYVLTVEAPMPVALNMATAHESKTGDEVYVVEYEPGRFVAVPGVVFSMRTMHDMPFACSPFTPQVFRSGWRA